jgi:hypothetical protein
MLASSGYAVTVCRLSLRVADLIQFRDDTARHLAKQLLVDCTKDTSIAVISAPSVFIQLRNLLAGTTLLSRVCY